MEGILKYLVNVLKVIGVFFCLYCFICSLDILSTSFKLLAGEETGKFLLIISNTDFDFILILGKIFQHDILQNPVIGLMIGILGTVLVQSSSTFSSIIVAGIGSGMVKISIAVPMIMGANIGTSVTNTLVAMTQVGNPEEFERAFSAATVHDMFNWSAVILLFTVEVFTKLAFTFLSEMKLKYFPERIEENVRKRVPGDDDWINRRQTCHFRWIRSKDQGDELHHRSCHQIHHQD